MAAKENSEAIRAKSLSTNCQNVPSAGRVAPLPVSLRDVLSGPFVGNSVRDTKRTVIQGWREGASAILTPDDQMIADSGFCVFTRDDATGRPHHYVTHPTSMRLFADVITQLVRKILRDPGNAGARHVVDVAIPGSKRKIRVYPYADRVAHAALASALNAQAESVGLHLNSSHAYRRNRGVYTALEAARVAQRTGHRYCVSMDISACFDSITTILLSELLTEYADLMAPDISQFILAAFSAQLLRRPGHPDRADGAGPLSAPLYHVLVGSALGPVLCNIVLSRFLDGPIQDRFGDDVCFLRYADDCLVLARTECAAREALSVATSSLDDVAQTKLCLHPEKGTKGRVVRLDDTRVPWLGYVLHGKRICTPDSTIARWQERLATAGEATFSADLTTARSLLRYVPTKQVRVLDAAVARARPQRRGRVKQAFETRPTAKQTPDVLTFQREVFYGVLNPLFRGDQ